MVLTEFRIKNFSNNKIESNTSVSGKVKVLIMGIFKNKSHNEVGTKNKSRFTGYVVRGAETVYRTAHRFPVTILLFVFLAGLMIYRVETPYERLVNLNTMLDRLMAVAIMGIPLSLCVEMTLEKTCRHLHFLYRLMFYIVELGALVLYYLFLMPDINMVTMVRLMLLTGALLLGFLFIPYLPRKGNFEVYITRIISRVVVTGFFSVVLGLGIMAIIFAIKSLLFTGLDEDLYMHTWILVATIFAPFYFLSRLPRVDETFAEDEYNKILKILLMYIVLPIMSVYTAVLYIYFAKIIITWAWPTGIVSYLVVSYTAIGIAAIFLVSPFRSQSRWVEVFISAFTKLIFPLLIMMFISIGIRIGDFGFTENRYFILIIGLWSTGIMIYLNLVGTRKNIVLPVSLAIVAIIAVFGPLSAFSVSIASQNQRFYNIVSKYDMIEDGKVRSGIITDKEDKKEIAGILTYFERSHQLSDLKYLPSGFTMNDMQDVFGFSEFEQVDIHRFFSFGRANYEPLPISGYDFMLKVQAYKDNVEVNYFNSELSGAKGRIGVTIDKDLFIIVLRDGVQICKVDLKEHINSLIEKYGNDRYNIENEDMVYTIHEEAIDILVSYGNMHGTVAGGEQGISVTGMDADIFIRIR